MGTIVVKNLPDQLHEQLRRQAQRNHRSLTKEIITLIEASVTAAGRELPAPLKLKSGRTLTKVELQAAITDGRYTHYKSLDELNRHMDELRADRDEVPR